VLSIVDLPLAAGTLILILAAPEPTGTLTLPQALELAARHSPSLEAAAARLAAAQAQQTDAGRRPNPVLTFEAENFAGSVDPAQRELTLAAGQTFELGGKRDARAGAAAAAATLAAAERDAEGRHVAEATAARFVDGWVVQERSRRLGRAERLAADAVDAADARHRAGAAPVVERLRAEALHAQRSAEARRARVEADLARGRLAAQWGATSAGFDSLVLDEPPDEPVAAAESLAAELERHPDRAIAAASAALAAARAREARSARTPDLSLLGGVRHLGEDGDVGLIALVAMELPVWNARRGGLAAAEAQLGAAAAGERAASLRLRDELRGARERYVIAVDTHRTLRDEVGPHTAAALEQLTAGYRGGRFGSLELLEGQRAMVEVELALIDAAAEAWRSRAELERLLGRPLGTEGGR